MIDADRHILLVSRRALGRADRLAVAGAAAVILPQTPRPDVYELVAGLGKPHFPRAGVALSLDGKVGNLRLLTALGLPHPASVAFAEVAAAVAAWRAGRPDVLALGRPVVVKGAGGGMGQNVFLVNDPDELSAMTPQVQTHSLHGPRGLVLQRFIDGGGADLRVVLLGLRHEAYWRVAPSGQWRSNLSQGGQTLRDWRSADMAQGVALARRLQRAAGLDMAGVDVLIPPGGQPLLLEINFYFGRGGLGGTASFLELYLAAVGRWLAALGLDPGRARLCADD